MGRDRRAPCGCGSGRRYKSCCFARDRARQDAAAAARQGLERIDEVLRVFLPLVESRGEHRIACQAGCNACCANYVRASAPEAILVAEWLGRPEQAAVRARFLAKLPGWRQLAGDAPRELDATLDAHGGTPAEGPAWTAYREACIAYARRGNLCPFNEAGRCEIYPVRPAICRTVYVVDTAEYCTPDRGGDPKIVSHPALDERVAEARQGCVQAARRLGDDGRNRALPERVAWALGQGG